MGTMCPFSSLHPKKRKRKVMKIIKQIYEISKKGNRKKIMPSGP